MRTKSWLFLPCLAACLTFGPLIGKGQNEDASKGKPSPVTGGAAKKSRTAVGANKKPKPARPQKFVDDRLKEGYQPLVSLEGASGGGRTAFTLGAIPQSKPEHIFDFTKPDAASIERRISHENELIAAGKQDANVYARRAQLRGGVAS